MSRYIDADALLASYKGNILTAQVDYAEGIRGVIQDIEETPSIDIVFCKDCRYWKYYEDGDMRCELYGYKAADDFCSYGERSE